MLEFLLAFPPVLVLILMIIEFSFYVNINHFTQYAAFAAARSRLVYPRDSKNPAAAAALAMAPFADAGPLHHAAPLTAWLARSTPAPLFGTTTNHMAPPPPRDYWKRAKQISAQTGLTVVPVIQGSILGKR